MADVWTNERYAEVNLEFNTLLVKLHDLLDRMEQMTMRPVLMSNLRLMANDVMFEVTQNIIALVLDGHKIQITMSRGYRYVFEDGNLVIESQDIDLAQILARFREISLITFSRGSKDSVPTIKSWFTTIRGLLSYE